jgi:hypothetical protein
MKARLFLALSLVMALALSACAPQLSVPEAPVTYAAPKTVVFALLSEAIAFSRPRANDGHSVNFQTPLVDLKNGTLIASRTVIDINTNNINTTGFQAIPHTEKITFTLVEKNGTTQLSHRYEPFKTIEGQAIPDSYAFPFLAQVYSRLDGRLQRLQ